MAYFFIFLTPLINLALFELFFFRNSLFYWCLIISIALILVSVQIISGKKIFSRDYWNFCIFPVLFSGSLAAYSLLQVGNFTIQLLYLFDAIFIFYYLKNIYGGRRDEFLENISSYGNFFTIFFSFAAIYGLSDFLGAPVWILVLAAAAIITLIIYQIFWVNRVSLAAASTFMLLSCLTLIEIGWALFFSSFNYNILGLLLAVCYYVVIGLTRLQISGKATSRNIRLYLLSGSLSITILLLAAKWV